MDLDKLVELVVCQHLTRLFNTNGIEESIVCIFLDRSASAMAWATINVESPSKTTESAEDVAFGKERHFIKLQSVVVLRPPANSDIDEDSVLDRAPGVVTVRSVNEGPVETIGGPIRQSDVAKLFDFQMAFQICKHAFFSNRSRGCRLALGPAVLFPALCPRQNSAGFTRAYSPAWRPGLPECLSRSGARACCRLHLASGV